MEKERYYDERDYEDGKDPYADSDGGYFYEPAEDDEYDDEYDADYDDLS